MKVYLKLLGDRTVSHGTSGVNLTVREGAVLAVLLLAKRPVSRDEVALTVWPQSSMERAKHSLSQVLYTLSSKAPFVEIRRQGARLLLDDVVADFDQVIQLTESRAYSDAACLYRGKLLGNEDIDDPGLADWRDNVDMVIARSCAIALHEWSTEASARAQAEVARQAEILLSCHPELDEVGNVLQRALAASGQEYRRPLALARFEVDEREESPSPSPAPGSSLQGRSSSFVGRSDESRQMMAAWNAVQAGHGQVALIEGEPGIGKTRFANQMLRRMVISGGRAWVVSCNAATQRIPYSGVADLLRDNLTADISWTDDPDLAFLSSKSGEALVEAPERRHRLVQKLTTIVELGASKAPLAIFVDDVQWADEFTSLLLTYWSFRLRELPVLLMLATRIGDTNSPPEWLVTEFSTTHKIVLQPLNAEDSAALLRVCAQKHDLAMDEAVAALLLRQSAGRPYLLLESLAAVIRNPHQPPSNTFLTDSVESMLRRKLHGLPENILSLLGFLAVMRRRVTFQDLLAFQRHFNVDANRLTDPVDRGVLTWLNGEVDFSHELMKETTYRAQNPLRRAMLHRLAAEYLTERQSDPAEIAHHHIESANAEGAGEYSLRAAATARSAGLLADEEYFLRSAVTHGSAPHKEIGLLNLARLWLRIGRSKDILSEIPEGYSLTSTSPELDRSLSLLRTVAAFEHRLSTDSIANTNVLSEASELLTAALLPDDEDLLPVAGLIIDLAIDAAVQPLGDRVFDIMDALEVSQMTPDTRVQIGSMKAAWIGLKRGYEEGMNAIQGSIAALGRGSTPRAQGVTYGIEGIMYLLSGRVHDSIDALTASLRIAQRVGDIRRTSSASLNLGVALLERAEFDYAEAQFADVLSHRNLHSRIRVHANFAVLHLERGQYALAASAAERVAHVNRMYEARSFQHVSEAVIGLASLATGDLARAHEAAARLEGLEYDFGAVDQSYTAAFLARMAVLDQRPDDGIRLLHEDAQRTERYDRIRYLRLLAEKAELMVLTERSVAEAISLARNIAAEARPLGAELVARRCDRIIAAAKL